MNTENEGEDKNTGFKSDYMGLSYWQRVFSGFAGGIFFAGAVWAFVTLNQEPVIGLIASIILLTLGVISLYYGRYGG